MVGRNRSAFNTHDRDAVADLGTGALLSILMGTSLLGAVATWMFGIETKGINLETLGKEIQE